MNVWLYVTENLVCFNWINLYCWVLELDYSSSYANIELKMELRFTPQRIVKYFLLLIYENGALYKTEHMIRAIVFWGITTALWLGNYFSFLTSITIAFIVYFCIGGWKYMILLYNTLPRDLRYVLLLMYIV